MNDISRLANLLQDDVRMQRLEQALLSMERHIEALTQKAGVLGSEVERTAETTKEGGESAVKVIDKMFKSLEAVKKENKELATAADLALPPMVTGMLKLSSAIDKVGEALGKVGTMFKSVTREMYSLQTGADSAVQRLATSVPYIGSFLGMMLEATRFQEDARAEGRRALLPFRQTGFLDTTTVSSAGSALGDRVYGPNGLVRSGLMNQGDLGGTMGALAQGGFSYEESMKTLDELGERYKVFGREAAMVSIGIDKAFGLNTGSAASFAAKLASSTNIELEASLVLVEDIGSAAYKMGVSMDQAMGSIAQVTQALRMQGGSAKDLLNTMRSMGKTFHEAMGGGAGAKRLASEFGMTALGDLGSFVTGMSEGVRGFIAEDVAKQMTGGPMDILQALRGMETGFQFEGRLGNKSFESVAAQTAFARLTEGVESEGDQYQILRKVAGMTPLLAEFMIRTKGRGFDSKDPEDVAARKRYEKAIEEQSKQGPLTISAFETQMRKIEDTLKQLSLAGLTTLTSILRVLIGVGEMLAVGFSTGDFATPAGHLGAVLSDAMVNINTAWSGVQFDKLGEAFAPIKKGLGFGARGEGFFGASSVIGGGDKAAYEAAAATRGPLGSFIGSQQKYFGQGVVDSVFSGALAGGPTGIFKEAFARQIIDLVNDFLKTEFTNTPIILQVIRSSAGSVTP